MTGYAMVRGEFDGWTVRVSVKSVNHRFLDVKLRMPDSLFGLTPLAGEIPYGHYLFHLAPVRMVIEYVLPPLLTAGRAVARSGAGIVVLPGIAG